MTSIKKERESNFELLRLFAMFTIVVYHLLGVYYYSPKAHDNTMLVALTSPFHVGVPLFVLISGYFGIRVSWRGVLKLLVPMFIYYVPIELIHTYVAGGGIKDYIHVFQFFSQTPYWFVQTYMWLFIASPAINLFIKDLAIKKRLLTLIVLAVVTMYCGSFGNDNSLVDGKNVLHFAFLYIAGDTLRQYKDYWMRIPIKIVLPVYILLNICLLLVYPYKPSVPMNLFFPYNSIGILINSIMLFVIFGKIRWRSKFVNYIAASSFIIYLVHGQPTLFKLQMNAVIAMFDKLDFGVLFILSLFGFSLFVMIISILIDKCLAPIYTKCINKVNNVI